MLLLYSFSAIEIRLSVDCIVCVKKYAHTSASRWHYILTRCFCGLKTLSKFDVEAFVVIELLPFEFCVD